MSLQYNPTIHWDTLNVTMRQCTGMINQDVYPGLCIPLASPQIKHNNSSPRCIACSAKCLTRPKCSIVAKDWFP